MNEIIKNKTVIIFIDKKNDEDGGILPSATKTSDIVLNKNECVKVISLE